MSNFNIGDAIRKFEDSIRGFVVSYGGDGTLLDTIRLNPKKSVIPIRSYGLCDEHRDILQRLLDGTLRKRLKYTKFPFLELQHGEKTKRAVSEFVVRSGDSTKSLRFNVFINGTKYIGNCISDGIILSSEMGSRGYWKSVTRTILRGDILGLGFLAPTCGIDNIILKPTDRVEVEITQDSELSISFDKCSEEISIQAGEKFTLSESCEGAAVFGYDIFTCFECRKNRNSTTVNDMYFT